MLSQPISVSIAFVRGMLSALEAKHVSCDDWLWAAGIPPALLEEKDARVSAEQYVLLFHRLIEELDDEGLGFFSQPLRKGTFAMLFRSILTAATLDIAMQRLCKGFELLQQDVRMHLVRQDGLTGLCIVIPPGLQPGTPFLPESLLRSFFRLLDWLQGGQLMVVGFDFAYPKPSHAGEYGKLFPGKVRFDQRAFAMWVNSADLRAPMYRDDAALRQFLAEFYRHIVIPRRSAHLVREQIREYLIRVSPLWPDLQRTAKALDKSASTLRRQLADEGTSFQMEKDTLRRDLAIVRLVSPGVPLSEIANELGFSDCAVFQRAFKSWTGSAPGAYRQQRLRSGRVAGL
ncbi:AraC family transcriptional regulator [Paraburkholderia sp. J63]|uniref:AraC family transcriptional regulator n=1 Tax=Paraburkholderia sp. J63 TaxID=2805434 RepID=UPI002ABE7561|nr:AraC family transcriptional regulator [Paraburkholderia sp. J63]